MHYALIQYIFFLCCFPFTKLAVKTFTRMESGENAERAAEFLAEMEGGDIVSYKSAWCANMNLSETCDASKRPN